jgi:hypothetical protein
MAGAKVAISNKRLKSMDFQIVPYLDRLGTVERRDGCHKFEISGLGPAAGARIKRQQRPSSNGCNTILNCIINYFPRLCGELCPKGKDAELPRHRNRTTKKGRETHAKNVERVLA